MSFSNRFGKGLLASLESEEEVVTDVVVDPVEAEDADNVEGALVEVAEQEAEVTGGVDAVDAATADADTLEEVATVLEETQQDGGADPVVARVAEVAVESIYRRLELKKPALKASLEAFGDATSRVEATRLSVESIRETIKKIWEVVVGVFTRIKDAITAFLKAFFVATERTLARAQKLKAAAASVKGAAKETEITGDFVAKLAKDGKFDKAYALATIDNISEYAAVVSGNVKSLKATKFSLKELVATQEAFDAFDFKFSSDAKALAEPAKKMFGLKDDDSTYWCDLFGEETGSNVVAVRMPVKELKGAEALKAISKVQVRVLPLNKEGVAKGTKAPVLSKEEAVRVCDDVIKGMKEFANHKKDMEEFTNFMSNLQKDAEGVVSGAKEEADAAGRSKIVAGAAKGFGAWAAGVSTQSTKLAVSVAAAGLDYAQKSLKAMGAEATEEPKAEAAAA